MDKRVLIQGSIIFLVLVMLFCNKKVRLLNLFKHQLAVYKNACTNKTSIWDILCFIVFPIIISGLVVHGLKHTIEIELAKHLASVFSAIFTILLGFAAVIVGKSDTKDPTNNMQRVINEAFVSIVTATTLSLFATVISILLIEIQCEPVLSLLSMALLTLSIGTVMLLLMVTKRIFVIYCDEE